MKVLITGGCGFIASNLIRYLLNLKTGYEVINLDALTYAGNEKNLEEFRESAEYAFVKGDICDEPLVEQIVGGGVDAIIHMAAETHVDRSILGPREFVRTNVLGTQNLLEVARRFEVKRFVHVSTDEVYGSLGLEGVFTEESPLEPNSPYAASKASSDLLVRAYVQTYGFPAIITRASNNYGPYQFPEKFIPLFLTNAMEGKKLPLYGDGLNVRDWLFVEDHCKALEIILHKGTPGEIYNIGGDQEYPNVEIAKTIVRLAGASEESIRFVKDRPGHDRRYALSIEKLSGELGWNPRVTLEDGLAKTVEWYKKNEDWWRPLKDRQYEEYYRKQYVER